MSIGKIKCLIICFLLMAHASYGQLPPGKLSKAHSHLEGKNNCKKCHSSNKKGIQTKCLKCHTEIDALIQQGRGYHASEDVSDKDCAICHKEHLGLNVELSKLDKNTFDHQLSGYNLEGKHATISCDACHNSKFRNSNISQKTSGNTFLGLENNCLNCHQDYHQKTLSSDCLSCHNQSAFKPATAFDHSQTNYSLIGKHKIVECINCHTIVEKNGNVFQQFAGIQHSNCTDCHIDVHNNKLGDDCRRCHSEFSFTDLAEITSFNHDTTAFPLKGMHQYVDCKACHVDKITKAINHNKCNNCHADYHQGQLAKQGINPNCGDCHTEEGFAPSIFTVDQHNQLNFPLEGAHLTTPCFACHKTEDGWNFAFPNNKCIQCHANVHEKILPEKYLVNDDCESCHSKERWSEITFDHKQTSYPLQGKHQEVACRNCHFIEKEGGVKQQFVGVTQQCLGCHTDVHFKQFVVEDKNDCERCHVQTSWSPEKFDHCTSRFVLEGKHTTLDCNKCHELTDGLTQNYRVYTFEDITCAKCH